MTASLELRHLSVGYRARGIEQLVLRDVSLAIAPGEAYGLVGESGCGKSTAAFAALQALPRNGFIGGGQVFVDGEDVGRLDQSGLRQLRLKKVSMVYQDPAPRAQSVDDGGQADRRGVRDGGVKAARGAGAVGGHVGEGAHSRH